MLPNKFKSEGLNIDLCFQLNNKVYFVELKIRDDHDSTKKRTNTKF